MCDGSNVAVIFTGVKSREINKGAAGAAEPADGDGVDYDDIDIEVTFRQGQTEVVVEIDINDDEIGEKQEAFEVQLTDANPESNNFIKYPSLKTVYINDDDGGASEQDDGDDDEDDGDEGMITIIVH